MRNLIVVIASCLLLSNSCKDDKFNGYDNRLSIRNNSIESIYFGPAYSYPDTSLYGQGVVPTSSTITYQVKAGETAKLSINCCWEDLIEDLSSDTLMIFIYDTDTLDRFPWEEVQSDYKILQRYDLSLGDLERLNFTVTYPPDATMVGVKMWPLD